MSFEQGLVLGILLFTMAFFIIGRWRHDVVALCALLVCVFAGLVPPADAFSGFGHPAVVTVACILILSGGLQQTGAVDLLTHKLLPKSSGIVFQIAALAGLGAFLSAFMNNVGAMALLIPVAVQTASKQNIPPGKILMPLSFATILGGTMTLIGTPPNIIVSGFRAGTGAPAFGMFDFTPAGFSVSFFGILFLALIGWRLVPVRKEPGIGKFDTGKYLTEVRVVKKSKINGKTFSRAEKMIEESDAQLLAMIRNGIRVQSPSPNQLIRHDDILIVETEPDSISSLLAGMVLKLEEDVQHEGENADKPGKKKNDEEEIKSLEGVALSEFVVMPYSRLTGRSASDINLRIRYGINLLAFSRRGKRSIKRLSSTKIFPGDVLLLQGDAGALSSFAEEFKLAPLADRAVSIPDAGKALKASVIMAGAIAATSFAGVHVAVSFASAAVLFLILGIIPLRSVYDRIDWPVIILLGALLPVAGAAADSGAADVISNFLVVRLAKENPAASLFVMLAFTMIMTDFINNAATAALMCPVALSVSGQLGVNPDTFLMAVAVGASCAFLTPIGHQNNTLILGPGGFRFKDYWRLGLPMDIIVLTVGVPVILRVWPL